MAKNYKEITSDISAALRTLHAGIPDTMKGFQAMGAGATAEAALSTKTKELIAIALGVAARCDGCIGFHTEKLVKLGVTKEEFMEALGMAVYMGGGPSLMYAAEAMHAFEQYKGEAE